MDGFHMGALMEFLSFSVLKVGLTKKCARNKKYKKNFWGAGDRNSKGTLLREEKMALLWFILAIFAYTIFYRTELLLLS